VLLWIWNAAHGAQACLVFPYAISMMYFFFSRCAYIVTQRFFRPEIILMSELNDNSDLQMYSSAVLYVLSAVTLQPAYIEVILDNFVSAIKSSTVRSGRLF
jgi:proteasome activator subunit 4